MTCARCIWLTPLTSLSPEKHFRRLPVQFGMMTLTVHALLSLFNQLIPSCMPWRQNHRVSVTHSTLLVDQWRGGPSTEGSSGRSGFLVSGSGGTGMGDSAVMGSLADHWYILEAIMCWEVTMTTSQPITLVGVICLLTK